MRRLLFITVVLGLFLPAASQAASFGIHGSIWDAEDPGEAFGLGLRLGFGVG